MRATKGFTIIEMIVVMMIIGIVVAMSSTLISAGLRGYFKGVQVSELNQEGSMAMMRMSKELQKAVSFNVINSTQVTFTTVDGATINYTWSAPTLSRSVSVARPLARSVTGFSLAYYQSNFSTTATLTAVRAITITMTLNNGNESIPLINTIFLINMK